MDDDSSIVASPRDYADIVSLGKKTVLDEFLDDPSTEALAIITGAFAGGGKGLIVSAGRIAQGLLKGQMYDVLADELRRLRDAGKIPGNLGETKHGLYTWAELMRIIDDECPDAERLEALKAMFFAVNKMTATDKDQTYAYQLWQITKELSSGELIVLKTINQLRNSLNGANIQQLFELLKERTGMSSTSLITRYVVGLEEKHLTPKLAGLPGSMGVLPLSGLTDLGRAICSNIETYQIMIDQMREQR